VLLLGVEEFVNAVAAKDKVPYWASSCGVFERPAASGVLPVRRCKLPDRPDVGGPDRLQRKAVFRK
jgi:hypothetical protein